MSRIGTAAWIVCLLLAGALVGGCGGSQDRSTSASTSAETQKHYRGGEKSIEEFGNEATGADRAALLAAFHGYLGALAKTDSTAACSYLAAPVQSSLRQLAGKGSRGPSCAAILPRILAPTAAEFATEQDEGRIAKVRVQGDRAFIVFHAPGAKLYQLTMTREGGSWRVTTVAPSILVPSLATR